MIGADEKTITTPHGTVIFTTSGPAAEQTIFDYIELARKLGFKVVGRDIDARPSDVWTAMHRRAEQARG